MKAKEFIHNLLAGTLVAFLTSSLLIAQDRHPDYERGDEADYRGKPEEANRYYESAAKAGDVYAQIVLADRLASGLLGPKDVEKAIYWYRKAAENPNWHTQRPSATARLAEIYENGTGVPKDAAQAARWYRKAAEDASAHLSSGHARELWHKLGELYEHGSGKPEDLAEALVCYRRAAEAGWNPSRTRIGFFYENGLSVAQDYAEAARWYQKAVDSKVGHGSAEAVFRLALLHQRGLGVPQSDAEGFKLLQRAATEGHVEAMAALGEAYENGRGVAKEPAEAQQWFLKAAQEGHAGARGKLNQAAKTKMLRYEGGLVPLPSRGDIPDAVRDLVQEINRELTPKRTGDNTAEVPPLSRELSERIRVHGAAISRLVQPLLVDADFSDFRQRLYLGQHFKILSATRDTGALETLFELHRRTPHSDILNTIADIGGDQAAAFLLATAKEQHVAARKDLPSDKTGAIPPNGQNGQLTCIALLARMQHVPALPTIAEILSKKKPGDYRDRLCVVLYGRMGDAAVPFLINRLGDADAGARHDAAIILGQWLIPSDAAPIFEQRYPDEKDTEIRDLLTVGLHHLISDLERQRSLANRFLKTETNPKNREAIRQWLDRIRSQRRELASAKANKRPSSQAIDNAVKAGMESGVIEYHALLNASTVADEPRLKDLRTSMLGEDLYLIGFDNVRTINDVILMNRLLAAQK